MIGRRWSLRGGLAMLLIAVVWASSATGVYLYLAAHRSAAATPAKKPGQGRQQKDAPISRLPGTLYLVQDGALYQLQRGTFATVLHTPGGAGRWAQPGLGPHGQGLLVVRRDYGFSDVYSVDVAARSQVQLTHNASRVVELNHWSFYPRASADGGSLYFSYDAKDRLNTFNVVLSIYQMPVGGSLTQAKRWTTPNNHTGGDLQPVPLASGGLIYTKYSFDEATSRILGQIWLTPRPGAAGRPLTQAADDCSQPALSPDGQRLAMICTAARQLATVEVALFDGAELGPREVLLPGQLAAQPTWSPDGGELVYLAAQGITGHFQLWMQQVTQLPPPPTPPPPPSPALRATRATRAAATPTPTSTPVEGGPAAPTPTQTPLPAPVRLTDDNDFDATSTIAWGA